MLKIHSKVIDGSGLQEIISIADISVAGASNALLSVHDIARARYVMQIVTASLYKLMCTANLEANTELTLQAWIENNAIENSNIFLLAPSDVFTEIDFSIHP